MTIHNAPPESRPRTVIPRDPDQPDDLTRIRGINPELASKLQRIGITHYDQIADWSATDIRSLSAALKLERKIYQQGWIEQAARLALRRRPASTDSKAAETASSSQQSASTPRARERSIAALVAAAAAAIHARMRTRQANVEALNTPGTPTAAPAQSTEPHPRQTAAPEDIPSRIAIAFRKIRETIASAPARFPEAVEPPADTAATTTPAGLSEPVCPAAPEPQPEAEPQLPAEPAPAAISAEALQPAVAAAEIEPTPSTVTHNDPPPPDDLRLIENLPQRVADRLNELGVYYFSEIAAFDAGDVEALSADCALGDRIAREGWIEQAALLAAGHTTKASRNRTNRIESWLVPYPAAPLQMDRKAFAALKVPRPAPPPARKWAPERPTEPSEQTAAAEPDAPVPAPQLTASLEQTAPALPEAGLLERVAERTTEPPDTKEPEPDAHREARHVVGFEQEEAEVTITPRIQSALGPALDASSDASTEAEQVNPAARSISLAPDFHDKDWLEVEPAAEEDHDHATYLANVGEASVEIVAARPRTSASPKPPETKQQPGSAPIEPAPSREAAKTGPQGAEQRAVSRFLKALRGR